MPARAGRLHSPPVAKQATMPPDTATTTSASSSTTPSAARRRQGQFGSFRASSLYCPKCREAKPVRERLLLVLPGKEIYDYLCTGCAGSVGQREVTAAEKVGGAAGSSLLVP